MPGLYTHTTRATGTILTAAIYNTDHQNHIDNQTPQMTDDYSSNAAQMQSLTDPGEAGTESLPTSMAGELERLRFAIREIKTYLGFTSAQWYSTPTGTVSSSLLFPSGTKMLFQQTAAPTGWTKDVTHNDKSLRVVTGAVSSGGATAFSSVFGAGKTTGSHVLTIDEIPAHDHTYTANANNSKGNDSVAQGGDNVGSTTGSTGGGLGHDHTLSLDLQYVDVIIATKD